MKSTCVLLVFENVAKQQPDEWTWAHATATNRRLKDIAGSTALITHASHREIAIADYSDRTPTIPDIEVKNKCRLEWKRAHQFRATWCEMRTLNAFQGCLIIQLDFRSKVISVIWIDFKSNIINEPNFVFVQWMKKVFLMHFNSKYCKINTLLTNWIHSAVSNMACEVIVPIRTIVHRH